MARHGKERHGRAGQGMAWVFQEITGLVICNVISDGFSEYNSSHWRGKIQCHALRQAGIRVHTPHVTRWLSDDADVRRMCSESDLIIIQRVLVEESLDRCHYWLERGKAIVCDFDDSYGLLKDEDESGNLAAKFWYRGEVEISNSMWDIRFNKKLDRHPMQQFIEGGGKITGFTMPSRILAEDWSYVNRCWYIPNYIDTPRYLAAKRPYQKKDKLTIGYGGSLSHVPSFRDSGILEALRNVFQKRDNVEFLLAGDERVYNMLPIPTNRKRYQPYVMWGEWPRIVSQFDITVAPLHARYDWSRSAIKLSEASIMGIPIVASRCPPYQDYIENNVGIYTTELADGNDPKEKAKRSIEWERLLLEVIDNYADHRREMERHFDYSLTWDVDVNVPNILRTYQEIIDYAKR